VTNLEPGTGNAGPEAQRNREREISISNRLCRPAPPVTDADRIHSHSLIQGCIPRALHDITKHNGAILGRFCFQGPGREGVMAWWVANRTYFVHYRC
jgi:hypothetical protein